MESAALAGRVADVRAFNRFYTATIHLLDEAYLDSPYSLTESRVIYEVGRRAASEPGSVEPRGAGVESRGAGVESRGAGVESRGAGVPRGAMAVADLRAATGIDAGYLSRILTRLEADGVITRERAPDDGRKQVVLLTDRGREALDLLDGRSHDRIGRMLEPLPEVSQRRLIGAMRAIQSVLGGRIGGGPVGGGPSGGGPLGGRAAGVGGGGVGGAGGSAGLLGGGSPGGGGRLGAGSSGGAGLVGGAGSFGGAGSSGGAGSFGGAGSVGGAGLLGGAGSSGGAGSVGGAGLLGGAGSVSGEDRRPAVVLRPPGPGDFGWVVERHGALYAHEYGWDATFESLVARIVADYVDERDPAKEDAWIAEVDGERVGCIFCVRGSEEGVAKLRLLLVDPSARGMGVGGRLVEECLRFARRVGYTEMVLWTQSCLDSARRIYARAGFELVKEGPHHSFGVDLVEETWHVSL